MRRADAIVAAERARVPGPYPCRRAGPGSARRRRRRTRAAPRGGRPGAPSSSHHDARAVGGRRSARETCRHAGSTRGAPVPGTGAARMAGVGRPVGRERGTGGPVRRTDAKQRGAARRFPGIQPPARARLPRAVRRLAHLRGEARTRAVARARARDERGEPGIGASAWPGEYRRERVRAALCARFVPPLTGRGGFSGELCRAGAGERVQRDSRGRNRLPVLYARGGVAACSGASRPARSGTAIEGGPSAERARGEGAHHRRGERRTGSTGGGRHGPRMAARRASGASPSSCWTVWSRGGRARFSSARRFW